MDSPVVLTIEQRSLLNRIPSGSRNDQSERLLWRDIDFATRSVMDELVLLGLVSERLYRRTFQFRLTEKGRALRDQG